MLMLAGEILALGIVPILTSLLAVAVHPLLPVTVTLYVVGVDGASVMLELVEPVFQK